MQRLITVGFRDGDVIFETARYRLIQAVHQAQHAVTGVDAVGDNAEPVHIHNIGDGFPLLFHLGVDAEQVLFAANNAGADAYFIQAVTDSSLNIIHHFGKVAAVGFNRFADHIRAHRIDSLKAQFFHFHADAVQTQAVGNGGVNIEGFAGNAAALFRFQRTEGAQVVQTVGQFDQNHTDVFGHGHGHLLEVFRLLVFFAFEIDVGELGNTVNQVGDDITELTGQSGFGYPGVFNHIMQHGGHQALMV